MDGISIAPFCYRTEWAGLKKMILHHPGRSQSWNGAGFIWTVTQTVGEETVDLDLAVGTSPEEF